MKKTFTTLTMAVLLSLTVAAQGTAAPQAKKVYDESINPLEQIDQAVAKAKAEGKHVICQVGGNWCPWCLRFADYIVSDSTISQMIAADYEYIHVNYSPSRKGGEEKVRQGKALMQRLNNAGRFGYPVLVVLDGEGRVIHIQDSGYLEQGESYDKKKVVSFFKNWTPDAVKGIRKKKNS